MKNIVLLTTTFLFFSASMLFSQGIRFDTTDWKSIVSRAKTEKKMIFVDFYTTWCGPCKRLEKEVFSLPEVGSKFNNSFINVRIDAEKGEGIELAAQFSVTAYPTSAFIKAENESIVYKIIGYLPANKYLAETDVALDALVKDPLAEMEFEYQKGNRASDLLIKMITKKKQLNRAIDRELGDYFSTYSVDSFFAKTDDRFYRDIRMDINEKALDLFMQRIGQINKSSMFTLNAPLKQLAEKNLTIAVEKARKERDEALLERILTYVSSLWIYKSVPNYEIPKYKMLFYRHGGDPDKLVEATELYMKTGHLMASTTPDRRQSLNAASKSALEVMKGDETLTKTMTSDSAATTKAQESVKKMPMGDMMNAFYAKEFVSILQPYLDFVSDQKALKKAQLWSRRLLDLEENATNMSIHAQIVHKSGNKTDGIAAQKKALELAKTEKLSEKRMSGLEAILKKMAD
jgi:thiol-disulfide isomerase/thioredoxin